MTDEKKRRPFYWETFLSSDKQEGSDDSENPHGREKLPPGQVLSALRRGVNQKPGSVPQMWPYYTCLTESGKRTSSLTAEHYALALFGIHQESETLLVHQPKMLLGEALARLRDSERYSPKAVEQRFGTAATASDLEEVSFHLRGLVRMMKNLNPILRFDYTQLFYDLRRWQDPELRGGVRRAWGAAFYWHNFTEKPTDKTTEKESE